ncbi:MAG: sensor histidine kinase [Eubacteriales bacterium]|nr:sensor histidine kinase [Eubacteriales bacterium]
MKIQKIRWYQIGILVLNVTAIMAISAFLLFTTNLISGRYNARDFLETVEAVPWNPRHQMILCGMFMALLLASFFLRETTFKKYPRLATGSLLADFFIAVGIVYLLNFNYNGILIMVFADLLVYVKNRKAQIVLMILALTCFILTNHSLMSMWIPLYSIENYIQFYDASTKQYLLIAYNVLSSMNIVLFVLYCAEVIMAQRGTIDEVNALYEELEKVNEQMQEYAAMSEKMAETRERNRLAREIHDTLGHTLTGISAGIDACITTIDIAPDMTKQQLQTISEVTRHGIREIRRSVSELRPDALERLRLDHAITKMVNDMSRVSGAKVYFNCEVKNLRFDEDEENAIYRVIQESITNAIRHGNASRIWITMNKEESDIILQIRDDGIGCKNMKSGFGTKHIKERIQMLGGTVAFDGSNGFVVNARIPIRWGENYD